MSRPRGAWSNQFTLLGFTLLETAIVLLILGLLLTSFLAPLAVRFEQQQRAATRTQLDALGEAIYGFVLSQGRLPCPDCVTGDGCNDGVEDRASGGCSVVSGNLPWTTLGVKGTDAWEQRFIYRVDADFSDDAEDVACPATTGVSFGLCSNGGIRVCDEPGSGCSLIASSIPAIVVSRGRNWGNTVSAVELENTDDDNIFVDRNYSNQSGEEFDDLLFWMSPYILKNRMVSAGLLP